MGDGYDGANYLIAGEVERTADLVSTNSTDDEITVSGDVTDDLATSPNEDTEDTQTDTFTLEGDTDEDGEYTVDSSPTYDSTADETTIPVSETIDTDVTTPDDDDQIVYNVFTDLAFQQSVTVNQETNIINADHKKKGFANKLPGKKDGNLSLDALQAPPGGTEEAVSALEKAKQNDNEVLVRRRKVDPNDGTTSVEEAPFLVSSFNENGDDNSAVTYSIDLEQTADWSTISSA